MDYSIKIEDVLRYKNPNPIKFNITARDGWQSNHGALVPVQDMIRAYENSSSYGVNSFQTAGGTFWDLPVKKGRDPFEFNQEHCAFYAKAGVEQRALIRGECGFSYGRQSYDVLKAVIGVHIDAGVTVFQNFNATNTVEMMRGVPLAVRELCEEKDIDNVRVLGGITIQQNPDSLERQEEILAEYKAFAQALMNTGHEGFYLKSANGIFSDASLFADVVRMLKRKFPDQTVDVHMHNTYYHSPAIYLAAIKAGADGVDVLPDHLAEGTAQMGLGALLHYMEHSEDPEIIARMPQGLNMEAIEQDRAAQLGVRGQYSSTEMPFNPEDLRFAEEAGSAGGAVVALKGVKDLIPNLKVVLKTDDWNVMRNAVYKQKRINRAALGYPTNVTPLELMQDVQAAQDVISIKNGKKEFDVMRPETVEYLSGQLGNVSVTADKDLQKRALEMARQTTNDDYMETQFTTALERLEESDIALVEPIILQKIENLPPALPVAAKALVDAGIESPTEEQILIAACSGHDGVKFVTGQTKPIKAPVLPRDLQMDGVLHDIAPILYDVAFTARELTRVRWMLENRNTVKGTAEWIEILQNKINVEAFKLVKHLTEANASQSVVLKARRAIKILATDLGADNGVIPIIDADMFSKGIVKLTMSSNSSTDRHVNQY
ncbi:MAG: hypothetical protein K0U40_06925 [Betaproteobacteria bacterium]|nr:hypothetical protein [Betaproteobacteria bacterium]